MKRFVATLPIVVVLFAFAPTAATQPAPRMARVGMLCSVSCTGDAYDALSDELGKLGWIEGTTIVIDAKKSVVALIDCRSLPLTLYDRSPISS